MAERRQTLPELLAAEPSRLETVHAVVELVDFAGARPHRRAGSAASLSASMADARSVLEVNLFNTTRILDFSEPSPCKGSTVVGIDVCTSASDRADFGHLSADPLASEALAISVIAAGTRTRPAYALSKRGVILLCEQLALPEARRGVTHRV